MRDIKPKKDQGKMRDDARRAGQKRAEQERVDDYGSRLRSLRNSAEYKAWAKGNRAMESSMDTISFRGMDRSRGRGGNI